jgi:hypothetical protein
MRKQLVRFSLKVVMIMIMEVKGMNKLMCGRKYNYGMYDWMEFVEYGNSANLMNNVVDKATEKFGPKPTPQQVA